MLGFRDELCGFFFFFYIYISYTLNCESYTSPHLSTVPMAKKLCMACFMQGLAFINLDMSPRYVQISRKVSHYVRNLESLRICAAQQNLKAGH